MALTHDQSDRLITAIAEIDQLLSETDEEGAEAILDDLYLSITRLLEQFPALDVNDG